MNSTDKKDSDLKPAAEQELPGAWIAVGFALIGCALMSGYLP